MQIKELTNFQIDPRIIVALEEMQIEELTDIQNQVIPSMIYNHDILAEAPTGTGKTFAFSLPMINSMEENSEYILGLVLTPTRELALQVCEEIRKLLKFKEGISVLPIFGGTNINRQISQLKKKPNIIVGTPGRVLDHVKRHTIRLHHINTLVLDECDVMLDMGFIKDINAIIEAITNRHQTALFSATISSDVEKVASTYLNEDYRRYKVKRDEIKPITQYYVETEEDQKIESLKTLLLCLQYKSMFIFVRTKKKAKNLTERLKKYGYTVTCLHGDMSQKEREVSLKSFRNKEVPILVATDVASRGIDVSNVDIVINYDIPEQDEYYLHRIGRVGRASSLGEAYTLINPKQKRMVKVYEEMSDDVIHPFVFKKRKDLKKMELTKILEDARKYLNDDLTMYSELIKNELELWSHEQEKEITVEQLCCALLKKINSIPEQSEVKEVKSKERDNSRKEKLTFNKIENSQRFFINIGSVDGLNEMGLFNFLDGFVTGLTLDDFADIYVCGTYSFFEIKDEFQDAILNGVEGQVFNGREVRIELSEKRKDKDSRGGRKSSRGEKKSFSGRGGDRSSRGGRGDRGGFGGRGDRGSRGGRGGSSRGDRSSRGGRGYSRGR